jgi:hypothetical protein
VKGDPASGAGSIVLQFLVVDPSAPGEEPTIARGINHEQCRTGQVLMFRYQLERPGRVHLVRVGSDGAGEVISPAGESGKTLQEPGVYDVYQDGDVLAVPLAKHSGVQNFCAVVMEDGPSPEAALLRAIREISQGAEPGGLGRVRKNWIDCFQIEVK